MDDRRGDRDGGHHHGHDGHHHHGHDGHHHGHGGERRGPPETEWLNLEMSKVVFGQAEELARRAGEELLKEAIKERLRERLWPKIAAIGALAADQLADDFEANIEIEAKIAAYREARRAFQGKLAEAFGTHRREPPPAAPPGEDPHKT